MAACNDTNTQRLQRQGRCPVVRIPEQRLRPPKTPGIWTTNRSGRAGHNEGDPDQGDAAGNYTNTFGGTSRSCPGAAGVAALILARNPALRWGQVKDTIKRSCDRIDPARRKYDTDGHSPLYSYGRLNTKKAVQLALPDRPRYTAIHTAVEGVPIKDLKTSTLAAAVGNSQRIAGIKIRVDIEHTYIGNLLPPDTSGAKGVVLHDRTAG